MLVQEIRGNRILDYSYDANGRPRIVKYRILNQNYEKCFYYALNSRNDVIGLYDENGSLIAKYNYDVWGNKLSVTNQNDVTITSDTHIANFQSLRYRSYYYDTDSGFYYLQSRYYDPVTHRFINADTQLNQESSLGYNMFAYCNNNPVNQSDPDGHWPKWVKKAASWVNKKVIQPVVYYFKPSTNTISGQFQDGILRGSGSLTGGYSEFNWRFDDKIKSSGSQDGWVGGFGKASVGNANGKIGIGNDNLSASLKGVADGLVATAQAGLHYKDGFGVGAKAKASVLSGRATTEFNIFGWQVELGVSGDVLSVGAEATIGIFPTDDGGKKFDIAYGVSPGLYGWGFVTRVKVPG